MVYSMRGGKIEVQFIKQFLNESYDPIPKKTIGNFTLMDQTETTRTYWDGKQCVFVIRGTNPTMNDWSNNLSYIMGNYKDTPRFKEAEHAYQKAVQTYGEDKISVVGHSQGGGSASLFPKSHEIITLNRAYKGESIPSNEYDIHATRDPVSALLNLRKPPHDVPIQSVSWNPLTNHSIDILNLLPQNQMIGQGDHGLGLTDTQLQSMCDAYHIPIKIMAKDDIHELPYGNYILNLNGSSHWTALIRSPNGTYYWDSFGFPPPEIVERLSPTYLWNSRDIQDLNSSSCGYYCIAFLKFMMYPTPQKYQAFLDLFSNQTKQNEKILFSILNRN